jgi:hypothetical protein
VSSPQRLVLASVLLAQGGVQPDKVLVRDHGGENDVAISPEEIVDLAHGNVFYVVPSCDSPATQGCIKPAKLAFFVDDRPEITLNPNQTGKTIRELFGLRDDVNLVRDLESPEDEPVGLEDVVTFDKGPVFITRRQHSILHIIVNSKKFTNANGVKDKMTGRQIASLVSDSPDSTEVFELKKDGHPPEKVPMDTEIPIHDCEEFRVVRNNVAGGFEPSRIHRELEQLKQGGFRADFIQQPVPAVIYRDVPTRPGYPHLAKTDVLVMVPGGYPGGMIDGAYLPQGSVLIGRVLGQAQGNVHADGLTWQLISYHPHNGGGGPPWNKDKHGFHTYLDEILCWIHRANN